MMQEKIDAWLKQFEADNGRKPTAQEFQDAKKKIDLETEMERLHNSEQSGTRVQKQSEDKTYKHNQNSVIKRWWFWLVIVVVLIDLGTVMFVLFAPKKTTSVRTVNKVESGQTIYKNPFAGHQYLVYESVDISDDGNMPSFATDPVDNFKTGGAVMGGISIGTSNSTGSSKGYFSFYNGSGSAKSMLRSYKSTEHDVAALNEQYIPSVKEMLNSYDAATGSGKAKSKFTVNGISYSINFSNNTTDKNADKDNAFAGTPVSVHMITKNEIWLKVDAPFGKSQEKLPFGTGIGHITNIRDKGKKIDVELETISGEPAVTDDNTRFILTFKRI
ncbi:hypothetical protein [uncultured Lacticaseibacillus sp.]|uniref:hypothetical protein n=1 Tax=uncultured Lacticaseibacillus sp. TaxID=2775882 RepID=UPI002595CB63|nr:hypothetical protein [uncultured Lacticaseibacillus sp.]